ncbi:MAG: arsenosugar biosynthesis radical SAM protein ArsS [Magnetococcales bacterium]|nr:arsenosugar biosynthesis radical SAM protein ArsS [Magnetococcales bacterium]
MSTPPIGRRSFPDLVTTLRKASYQIRLDRPHPYPPIRLFQESRYNVNRFQTAIQPHTNSGLLQSRSLETIQANIGLRCNLQCQHCHVAASPQRKERMAWDTMAAILDLANTAKTRQVDLTGGAPELHPHIRRFISELRGRDMAVQLRTNLSALLEPECAGLAEFLRDHAVQLVASLPCYLKENVDRQRGDGSYDQAVMAMKLLNNLGYGTSPALALNLVYNPGGPSLPPNQRLLESDYRRALEQRFGLRFTSLLTIANMPIGRFLADLRREGQAHQYQTLLEEAFNPTTLDEVMCRNQLSIGWDGLLYDCDFNLALEMPIGGPTPVRIQEIDLEKLAHRTILTGNHCFGCTAGQGSSCGGALAA